ncbi:putative ABC transport system ATP-binding protein/lipoprotein-releasing system ATP-binding protein [Roseimicrobium gellanilyticum]|uniref:Putative ABC transport system ATP-binding protein/lipoprotein-releasing system ATP-binding protein n=1 Tax=Roseimicrobium gellanilyticum TaxID=748857 RepID=A0A366H844_9BACT|nr:ABC transporter ATP-binding protein [Roseimicrobium gellanilyticum]RBP37736.1 putative ABC transport system ATP-binding protein/lipoprotein-releasing system ATP-binding protein [Roseimicrobium gellanilyticum]
MPDTPALEVKDVHRRYHLAGHELHVLKGISLRVEPGEKVFLCGASGSGKTTLLYILGGLERPTEGDVYMSGQPMYAASKNKRAQMRNTGLGFVFQNYHLLPELTALENVMLPSLIKGKPTESRAKELLGRVGLGQRLDHLPTELSGGEQQRVALARSLINDPPILLADEPTGNLDAATGKQIMDLLFEIVSESKKTLVVVTHDATLAERGDRKLVIKQGQLEGGIDLGKS